MMTTAPTAATPPFPFSLMPVGPLCVLLRPVLGRIVRRIGARHPGLFSRVAPYECSDFVILVDEFPFALHLRPDPDAPLLRAVPRHRLPPHEARIEGRFLLLLELVDGESDGDAAFFSRELTIAGNTEAVVSLRNALDDLDGSIAQETADLFGPPGRALLDHLRHRSGRI